MSQPAGSPLSAIAPRCHIDADKNINSAAVSQPTAETGTLKFHYNDPGAQPHHIKIALRG